MKRNKHLLRIALLSTVFVMGIGLVVVNNDTPTTNVIAEQHLGDYAPYTYSGSYYDSIDFDASEGMNGNLRKSLSSYIYPKGFYTYSSSGETHLSTQLQYADEDPTNSSNMVYLYTRNSVTKSAATVNGTVIWNREHVWCQSLSNGNWGTDKGGTDILHLRPVYASTNSSRNNNPYGDTNKQTPKYYQNMLYGYLSGGYFEPIDSVKGDVARIIMYLWVTYNNDSKPLNILSVFKDYNTLLTWHTNDKPDVLEGNRNDYSQTSRQKNRNPFVDHPELGWKIFGDNASSAVKTACMEAYPSSSGGEQIEVTGISLNKASASLKVGKTIQLTASLSPNGATGAVSWSSDNSNVASVDDGLVTANGVGNTIIRATCNGYEATCNITVSEALGDFYGEEDNPITVDDAIELITKSNGSVTPYPMYIKGTVSNNDAYNSNYKNYYHVYFKTDENSTSDFHLFKAKASDSITTTYEAEDSLAGYNIVAYGYGKKFNNTYELTSDNNLDPANPVILSVSSQDINDYLTNATPVATLLGNEGMGLQNVDRSVKFSEEGYSNGQELVSLSVGNVTLTFSKADGSNTPKYYDNGSNARLYKKNTLTFSSSNSITRIEFTFSNGYATGLTASVGTLTDNVWTGNATSVVFINSNDNTDQIRFTDIAVRYSVEAFCVTNVGIRFGTLIPKDDWTAITEEFDIDDYGIMMFKEQYEENTYSSTPVEDAYKAGKNLAIARKGSSSVPYEIGDDYRISAKVNVSTYDIVFAAASFIVIDGEYHFFNEIQYSVNSLANYHLVNGGSSLSNDALTLLSSNN